MAIGVKETQEIIRQAAVISRNEPAVPAKLDPQEVGMATGPRHRKRSLLRACPAPDYLDPVESSPDEWQKLDDDIYKFLQVRRDQFARLASPPSQQFISEMEAQLKLSDNRYDLGSYLGLLRQAADLDQTRQTYVTASEKSTFHAFARRITEGRKTGEVFDPGMVKRFRDLLESNHPTTYRGLADLFRLVSRAARLPLIGSLREAPSLSVAVVLQVVDLSTRFNQQSHGSLEFHVGPMDVFLGARTVLFNRSVANPTLSIVKELVLDETGLYHDDLLELLQNVGVFGSELTLLIPESLTEDGFALQGSKYSAVELVMAAGAKLAKSQGPVERAMTTLADAIVHKVQLQDGHKDLQIQSILAHFNRLLQGERRSAARVTEDRQQARFDYMTAIQKASQLAKGMQTGRFPAMQSGDQIARPIPQPMSSARLPGVQASVSDSPWAPEARQAPAAAVALPPEARTLSAQAGLPMSPDPKFRPPSPLPDLITPAAAVVGGISIAEYEVLLGTWDQALGRIRKKLTTKSPVFKTLASQLAKVRSLDTCLAYGLTPAGGRATGRLAKLIQSDELRGRLGVPAEIAEAMEDAFSMDYPGFLASLESLITALYDFKPALHTIQFRLRDRLPAVRPGLVDVGSQVSKANLSGSPSAKSNPENRLDGRETTMWADAAELDEVALRLLMGSILLGLEMAGGLNGSKSVPQFQNDDKLRFPAVNGLSSLGDSDPFLAFATLLWSGKRALNNAADPADLESSLMRLIRLSPEERQAMKARYTEWIGPGNRPSSLVPGLGKTRLRDGWHRGFERGFMAEVQAVWEGAESSVLEQRLMELLTEVQTDIDLACETLEGEKSRLTRERLARILN
ncbi:MAG: hypothetical protein M3Y08_11870 [Fibrobacterota bacterium]|nr:hypothetical protein [Fibrobacterota bacterium]